MRTHDTPVGSRDIADTAWHLRRIPPHADRKVLSFGKRPTGAAVLPDYPEHLAPAPAHPAMSYSRSLISVFLLCLLVASASALLFGRSSIVQPPPIVVPSALAIVDRDTRVAVLFTRDPDLANLSFWMTKTTALRNGTAMQRARVSRRIEGINPDVEVQSPDVYVSEDQTSVAILLSSWEADRADIVVVSLLDWRVLSTTSFPNASFTVDSSGWMYGTYSNGSLLAILVNDDTLHWIMPNGTIASKNFPNSPLAWLLNDTTLYVLVERKTFGGDQVRVMSFDLVNANATLGPWLELPDLTGDTAPCAFAYGNATTAPSDLVAFIVRNDTTRFLISLDPSTMALSSTELFSTVPLAQADRWKSIRATCALISEPDSLTTQFLLFDASGLSLGNLSSTPPSISHVAIQGGEGFFTGAALDKDGTLLVSTCDTPAPYYDDTTNVCALLWFDSVSDGAATKPYSPAVPPMLWQYTRSDYMPATLVSNSSLGLGVYVVNSGSIKNVPEVTVLITDLATSSVATGQLLAWFVLSPAEDESLVRAEVDPVTLAVYMTTDVGIHVRPLFVVDWSAMAGFGNQFAAKFNVHIQYDSEARFLPYNSTIAFTEAELFRARVYLYQVTASGLKLATNRTIAISEVSSIYRLAGNDSMLFVSKEGVVMTDASLQERSQWQLPQLKAYSTLGAAVLSADQTTLYLWISGDSGADGQSLSLCCVVNLTAPDSLVKSQVQVSPRTMPDYSVGTVAHNFLFVAATSSATSYIMRFSLQCELQSVEDTQLTNERPLLAYTDRVLYGVYPVVSPLYLDCGAGTFRNVSDARCTPCPNGTASVLVDTQTCLPCPSRTQPDAQRMRCVCAAGYFSPANDQNCSVCVEGGACNGGNSLAPLPGYWRVNVTSSTFYACPLELGCNGSDVCAAAYTGPLCAVCAAHHAVVASACLSCSSPLTSGVYWLVAAAVYATALVALLLASESSFSVLKSFVSFAQIVTFPVSGPLPHLLRAELSYAMRLLALANLQVLSIVSPDCVLGFHLSYPIEAVAAAVAPLVIVGALLAFFFALPWHRITCGRGAKSPASSDPFEEQAPSLADKIVAYRRSGAALRVTLFVALLCTPSATQQLASYFNCQDVAGVLYLVRDYSVQCYAGVWVWLVAPVCVLLCVYAVGVPAALFTLLYRYRDTLDVRFLHRAYRDDYYWWDCTEYVRKLVLLILSAVLAPRAPAYYALCSFTVCVVALSIHLKVQAHARKRDFWFQCASLVGVCLFFLWSLLATDQSQQQEGTADTVAWAYWVFALCYALASLAVLLTPIGKRAIAALRARGCCKLSRGRDHWEESELDALVPRKAQSK